MLLFDLTRPETFHALAEWIDIVRNNTKNIPILLVSSKQDLIDAGEPSQVSEGKISEFINMHGLRGYMTISATTGLHVKEMFTRICEFMIERNMG